MSRHLYTYRVSASRHLFDEIWAYLAQQPSAPTFEAIPVSEREIPRPRRRTRLRQRREPSHVDSARLEHARSYEERRHVRHLACGAARVHGRFGVCLASRIDALALRTLEHGARAFVCAALSGQHDGRADIGRLRTVIYPPSPGHPALGSCMSSAGCYMHGRSARFARGASGLVCDELARQPCGRASPCRLRSCMVSATYSWPKNGLTYLRNHLRRHPRPSLPRKDEIQRPRRRTRFRQRPEPPHVDSARLERTRRYEERRRERHLACGAAESMGASAHV